MPLSKYIELAIATAFCKQVAWDAQLFTRRAAFKDIPETIAITSPDNGNSGSTLRPDCTQVGADSLPELTWTCPRQVTSRNISWGFRMLMHHCRNLLFTSCFRLFLERRLPLKPAMSNSLTRRLENRRASSRLEHRNDHAWCSLCRCEATAQP